MRVTFWGTRGSIATPGAGTTTYGGNTSCVEVRCGTDIFIFDAGTGIRPLGLELMKEFANRPVTLHLF
ncbi:MAG TPA: phytochrome sensor protein, partial [Chthoniobacterales bacterium]|nr:phytochrome sensor protein [Chthoniobacterales bacterium]